MVRGNHFASSVATLSESCVAAAGTLPLHVKYVFSEEERRNPRVEIETSSTQGSSFLAPLGNKHRFNGVIHEFSPNRKITRTFEMENTPVDVWLEYLEFHKLTDDTSKLNMHVVYKSVALRDQMLQLPFAQGINMAHNRLQDIASKLDRK